MITNLHLKFRTWDTKTKKMVMLVLSQGTHYPNEFIVNTNDAAWVDTEIGKVQQPLMQFTGLQDKNGTDIYFGDILATSNTNEEYDIWNKEALGYTLVQPLKGELGVSFSNWALDTDIGDESVYNQKFVEIIGNIYDNPELLK